MITFNKDVFFNNIYILLKKRNIKIGDFEEQCGVSTGYIARAKDGNTKPGIDFVVNAADVLGISVDTLATVDLSVASPTEQYLLCFFNKLIAETQSCHLNWEVETPANLRAIEPKGDSINHPLLKYYIDDDGEYMDTNLAYQSMSFGTNISLGGNFYHLGMKNGVKLYLTMINNLARHTATAAPSSYIAREVWMIDKNGNQKYVARNNDGTRIAPVVDLLYKTVEAYSKVPKFYGDFKAAIDDFVSEK